MVVGVVVIVVGVVIMEVGVVVVLFLMVAALCPPRATTPRHPVTCSHSLSSVGTGWEDLCCISTR